MKRVPIILAVAVTAVFLVQAACAQMMGGPRGQGYQGQGYQGQGYQTYPQLTAEQEQQFAQMQREHYQNNASLRQQYYSLSSELEALLSRQNPDQDQIMQTAQQICDVRSKLFKNSVRFRLDVAERFDIDVSSMGLGYGPGWENQGTQGYGRRGPGMRGPGYGPGMMGPGMMRGPRY
jgi:Spy/CpxP family protein refolding chaperone